MARLFASGSSEYLKHSSKVNPNYPYTCVGYFRTNTLPDQSCIISFSDDSAGGTTGQDAVTISSNTGIASGSYLTCWSRRGAGSSTIDPYLAAASTTCTVDTWHSFVAVWASESSRAIYLDGANSGTNADPIDSTTGINAVDVGRLGDSTDNLYFNGDIAEIGVYNYAFSAADAAAFSNFISPLLFRPDALVAYWPINGTNSPEISPVGGFDLSVNATPLKSAHPRIIQPSSQILQFPPAAASGGVFDIFSPGIITGAPAL